MPDGPPLAPAAPPPTSGADDETGSSARRGGRARFVAGLFAGAALTGAAVGGYALGQDSSSSSEEAQQASTVTAAPISVEVGESAISQLVETARPSIVSVHQQVTQTSVFGDVEGVAAGTGWVLSSDGYIVTNNHVIADGDDTVVTFADGTTEDATVVAADPSRDLAVLQVDRDDLTPLAIGDSDALQLGDPLVAIGYALDLNGEPSVTAGILSAKDRTITEENGERLVNLLQTDTAINPGNSGGPLLNSRGEVVGINTAIAGQAQNIGFAIAITPVQDIIASLSEGTVPQRALMGVTTQPSSDADLDGAEIIEISPGSAADASDLEVGDVVTAIDDTTVDEPEDLGTAIATHQPGDEVTVTVVRDGTTHDVELTLGAAD